MTERMYGGGRQMYHDLKQKLTEIHNRPYRDITDNVDFLSDIQKTQLKLRYEIMDVKKLDLIMYNKIIRLFEVEENELFGWDWLFGARNKVCHLPMEKRPGDCSQEKFHEDFDLLNDGFQYWFSFLRDYLNRCMKPTFNNEI